MNHQFETLQSNMRILRTLSGSSQEQTAVELHISRSTYASYESGFRIPDLDILQNLSILHRVSLTDLVYMPMEELLYSRLSFRRNRTLLSEILPLYEALSPSAKNLIMEKIQVLREGERLLSHLYQFCDRETKSADNK